MLHRILTLLILLCTFCLQPNSTARILFLSPFTSKSHAIFYKSLLTGLVENNHTVRILASDKVMGNDYGHSVHETVGPFCENINMPNLFEERKKQTAYRLALQLSDVGLEVCKNFLKSKEVNDILVEAREKPFDVLLTGTLIYECAVPFAHILSIPRIVVSSACLLPWVDYALRSPPQWSYSPNIYLPYSHQMNFWERLNNMLYSLTIILHREWVYFPKLDSVIHEYLGQDIPSISDMDPDVSLVLTNSDPSIDYPRANQPNVIHLAGLHIKSSETIPKDLLEFMDNSGDAGVIFFSLGSVLTGSELPKEHLSDFVDAFKSIPQRVLWKWDNDIPPAEPMPGNILIKKWFPQQAILAHPKTKAFITHGGLGSCLEAVYHGVPIIGIPIFADQDFNIVRAVYDGSGISLDLNNLTKFSLVIAINKVTEDVRFRNAMLKKSIILKDKVLDPTKLGVYYVEHVIRHQGAPHLHTIASKLPWYQLYHVDVILFMLVSIFIAFKLLLSILKGITHCLLFNKRSKSRRKSKKTN